MVRNTAKPKKKYLIALEETHSIVALAAGILIFACALSSIFVMMGNYNATREHPLHYFTVWSNILSAVASAFMIPFAVEGVKKKRFILPRWIVLMQYAGANCLAITMVSSLAIILPAQGARAVSGTNFWLHIITPALTIVLFQSVETGIRFRRREALLTLIPYWVYMVVYLFAVNVLGENNGGWSDFYMTQRYWPIWISVLLMLAMGVGISFALFAVHNRQAKRNWKYIENWSKNLEPAELLIEAFGLGRYMGEKRTDGELAVPLDIFQVISGQYGVPVEKLTKAYMKGALDAIGERNAQ
ncbi:MAG: hypothetical protein II776_04785 [Clostridia bacterium]|nr:hypothetical protein [Clostridia bacterium]